MFGFGLNRLVSVGARQTLFQIFISALVVTTINIDQHQLRNRLLLACNGHDLKKEVHFKKTQSFVADPNKITHQKFLGKRQFCVWD